MEMRIFNNTLFGNSRELKTCDFLGLDLEVDQMTAAVDQILYRNWSTDIDIPAALTVNEK